MYIWALEVRYDPVGTSGPNFRRCLDFQEFKLKTCTSINGGSYPCMVDHRMSMDYPPVFCYIAIENGPFSSPI